MARYEGVVSETDLDFDWLKMGIHVRFCYGYVDLGEGLIEVIKKDKSQKTKPMQPLFWVYRGFLVIGRKGCEGFGGIY